MQTRTNKTIVKSVKCRIGQLHDTTCLSSTEAAVVCGRAWSGGEGQISLSHVSVEFSGQVRDVSCLGVVSTCFNIGHVWKSLSNWFWHF